MSHVSEALVYWFGFGFLRWITSGIVIGLAGRNMTIDVMLPSVVLVAVAVPFISLICEVWRDESRSSLELSEVVSTLFESLIIGVGAFGAFHLSCGPWWSALLLLLVCMPMAMHVSWFDVLSANLWDVDYRGWHNAFNNAPITVMSWWVWVASALSVHGDLEGPFRDSAANATIVVFLLVHSIFYLIGRWRFPHEYDKDECEHEP